MTKEQLTIESNILLALFRATVEQSSFLNGQLNQKPKQVFNVWQKQGYELLDQLEKRNIANEEYYEAITDVIHNIIKGIRDESNNVHDSVQKD